MIISDIYHIIVKIAYLSTSGDKKRGGIRCIFSGPRNPQAAPAQGTAQNTWFTEYIRNKLTKSSTKSIIAQKVTNISVNTLMLKSSEFKTLTCSISFSGTD